MNETPQKRLESFIDKEFKTKTDFAKKIGILPQSLSKYVGNGKSVLRSYEVIDKLKEYGLNLDWYFEGIGDMLVSKEVKSNAEVTEGINVDLIDVEKLTIEQIRFIHQKIQPYIEAYNENNLRKHRENEARKELSK